VIIYSIFVRDASHSLKALTALYEPLGVAIIRNDVVVVEQLIQGYPEILEGLNFNGETNCSLAVDRPEVLKAIVRRATPAQLVQRNDIRWYGVTPLGKAIKVSKAICETYGAVDESLCPCVAAVKILLEADCPIIPSRDFWCGLRYRNFFSRASKHCKFLVAKELRIRRRELRQLAEEKLHPSEYSPLCSSEAELDYQAIELDWLLRRKGFLTFGRLSSAGPSNASLMSIDTPYYNGVYSNLNDPEDASIFWSLGFRDLNIHSGVWSKDVKSKSRGVRILSCRMSLEYSLWLVGHCPRFWELLCLHHELEGPDYVLAEIIGQGSLWSASTNQVDLLKVINNNLPRTEVSDSCTCQCSPEGCTPFDLVMKWMLFLRPVRVWKRHRDLLLSLLLEDQSEALDLNRQITMIRQATFQALDMIHTCIDGPPSNSDSRCEYDYGEEDLKRARYLDNVVMEFQDFILREGKVVDCEIADASANGKQRPGNQDTVNHQRVLEFWNKVWPSRMQEIEEDLAATWSPDQKVLEDLGVSLWHEEEVDDDEEPETPEGGVLKMVEQLKRDLDMI
jgi:hypothetical protein